MSAKRANRAFNTRAEIEGKAYRMISFFQEHPKNTSEDDWSVFRHEGSVFLVDKLTLGIMAECECELLTRSQDSDSKEPAIVAVSLTKRDE